MAKVNVVGRAGAKDAPVNTHNNDKVNVMRYYFLLPKPRIHPQFGASLYTVHLYSVLVLDVAPIVVS